MSEDPRNNSVLQSLKGVIDILGRLQRPKTGHHKINGREYSDILFIKQKELFPELLTNFVDRVEGESTIPWSLK